MVRRLCVALGLWLVVMALPAAAQPARLAESVAAASRARAAAIAANDIDALVKLYRPFARSMPEHQPVLDGAEHIAVYHRTMLTRRRVTRYEQAPVELFELGDKALEIGTFTIAWRLADGSMEEERGKYANLWAAEPGGALKLAADIWGYFRPQRDPKAFFVAIPYSPRPPGLPAGDPEVAEKLRAINWVMAEAVRTRDAPLQIAMYTDDAVFMPFADTPKTGIDAIRAHLTAYVDNGRGATFDSVEVWNTGFEAHGDWVIEYPKFRVRWRVPGQSGVAKGGGLRLWKRLPDGSLGLHRQIGTHDAE